MQENYKKPRFINPPNTLKAKIGSGGIDESLLVKSQEIIENSTLDFTPYAQEYLKQITALSKKAVNNNDNPEAAKESLIEPVMQLKAHGGMFRYQLISEISNIALQFLENITEFNDDAHEVILAHHQTLNVIVNSKLTGDGGKEGYALVKELEQACQRYFAKHAQDKTA